MRGDERLSVWFCVRGLPPERAQAGDIGDFGMLRHVATALCFALAILIFFFTGDFSNSSTSAPAAVPVNEAPVHGLVRAVAQRERFDPFGEIVPLPVFRREQFMMPAFDPELYREGRVGEPLAFDEICEVLEEVAEEFDLPTPLFTRLIWQESRFRNETVSRAGAQGIAQFMPRTAELRGLDDPFDPLQALPASADFLRELIDQFGNFGLAAAAYNGGPTRVRNWLAGRGRLPKETRDYVLRITGRPAEQWRNAEKAKPHPDAFNVEDCKVRPIRAALSSSGRK